MVSRQWNKPVKRVDEPGIAISAEGYVESLTPYVASGWAWRPDAPDVSLLIEATVDGSIIGTAVADHPREDLEAAGKGTGRYGFNLHFQQPLTGDGFPVFRLMGYPAATLDLIPGAVRFEIAAPTVVEPNVVLLPDATNGVGSEEELSVPATAKAPVESSVFEGFVEMLTRRGVSGWVRQCNVPDAALAVEAVLDGKVIGSGIADQFREDLFVLGHGRGEHGFFFRFDHTIEGTSLPEIRLSAMPTLILQGAEGPLVFEEYVASAPEAEPQVAPAAAVAPVVDPSKVEGYVEMLNHEGATGWVWCTDAPDMALRVEAVVDDQIIGQSVAAIARADLAAAGKGSGQYGFSIHFDDPVASDQKPVIRVAAAPSASASDVGEIRDDREFAPLASDMPVDPALVEGLIEQMTRQGAIGWVWRMDAPDTPLELEAVLDGVVIGRAVADIPRSDLAAAGKGNGVHGFALPFMELLDGDVAPHLRLVQNPAIILGDSDIAAGSGNLPLDPVEEQAPAEPLSPPSSDVVVGFVESLNRSGVTGWVWRSDAPGAALAVEAELYGEVIGTAVADVMREDIAAAGLGTGRYGFVIPFARPLVGRAIPQVRLAEQPEIILGGATGTITLTETEAVKSIRAWHMPAKPVDRDGTGNRPDRVKLLQPDPDRAAKLKFKQFAGHRPYDPARPSILVVAHAAAPYLFGSERSFIDMVRGISSLDYNVFVAVPRNAPDYTNLLRRYAVYVCSFTYGWWKKDIVIDEDAIAQFADVIRKYKIKVVHSNTIMLRECLRAARRCNVQSMVHVRELITKDDTLINVIGSSCDDIIDEVRASSNWVIGNSNTTAEVFHKKDRTFTVYNTVDLDELDIQNVIQPGKLSFGLVSSNLPKKGLDDIVEIARRCEAECPQAEFVIIGPDTDAIRKLQKAQAAGTVPGNVVFAGYAASPVEAMAKVNVILSLSHFAESFGRTVLEAMAARRPVIAYEWGAIPELVEDGVTGYLIPFRSPRDAVEHVVRLCNDPALVQAMGQAGRIRALNSFGLAKYAEQLRVVYDNVLGRVEQAATMKAPVVKPAKLSTLKTVITAPKIAYFCWHFPVPSETFVLSELKELVDQGYDVMVFCKQSPHKGFDPGFPVRYEKIKSVTNLAQRLVETGRTIVHAHFVYPTVTDMVWPACEKANIPFTFMAHAQDIFKYSNDALNRLSEIGQSHLCLRMFTLSTFHLDFVTSRGFPREKVVINPNAVDTTRFTPATVPNREKRNSRKIIAVHRFVPKKGLDLLIRATPLLKDLDLRIELYGYGDSEADYRAIIEELQIDNVALCGRLDHGAIPDVMRTADLFACPSVRTADGDMDGIPTSIVESMAAGLPVLTTNIAGIPDLVVDGITGVVADPDVQSVADAIRRFYHMPENQVAAMIKTAQKRALQKHDVKSAVRVLTRVWENRTVDIVIVSWNNLKELEGVVERIQRNTAIPYHLIVCDNQSEREAVPEFLDSVWESSDNVTVIHNNRNAMVGPGTNATINQGVSDIIIYVCGKEGFSFANGWEIPFVHAMAKDEKVGLVGTVEKSPTYLTGAQYPKGIRLFEKFRNKQFAHDNPDRPFTHVQGGLFGLRRRMYDEIGGFSEAVPHDYTDVEYSFYAESRGWQFGPVDNMIALFNKTRPSLSQRFDETVAAAHPCTLDELATFEAVRKGELVHCNICDWFGEAFRSEAAECANCSSGRSDRTLYRWLGDSVFMFRRLPTLSVGLEGPMEAVWANQFQGPRITVDALVAELYAKARLQNAEGAMHICLFRLSADHIADIGIIAREARRLLKPGSPALFQLVDDTINWGTLGEGLKRAMALAGFAESRQILYSSKAVQFSYAPMLVFDRI